MNKVFEFLQTPSANLLFTMIMFLGHALYMRYSHDRLRTMLYLDVLDFVHKQNKKQNDIEEDFSNRMQILRNASFAPKMSSAPYIKLVPKSKKDA